VPGQVLDSGEDAFFVRMSDPKVHFEAVVIDGHADTPQRFVDDGWNFSDPLDTGLGAGMLNLETVRAGGLSHCGRSPSRGAGGMRFARCS
jgi:hypothetical protein